MARYDLDKASVINKLEARREPYWGAPIQRGLSVGIRVLEDGATWIARAHAEDKRHVYQSLGLKSATNTYDAAKEAARVWRKGLDAGVGHVDIVTVKDACAEYVKSLRRDKREKAALDSERRFARTVDADPLGGVRLDKLREHHLNEWRVRMESGEFAPLPTKRGRPPVAKAMSPSTFKRMLSTVKAALNHAVKKKFVTPDKVTEWEGVQPEQGADNRRDLYLDRKQRGAFLKATEGPLRDIVECVALTGCRPGDPAAALRKHYDGKSGSVTFTTKGHVRTIPLSPAAIALFDRLAKGKQPSAHLFTREDGKPWRPYDWHDGIREAANKAKLPRETVLYTLRHSWITDAIGGGMDPLTVAKLVGTSLAMIESNYGHLRDKAARESLAKLRFV